MFKIWLKFDEFEGIKNPLKDGDDNCIIIAGVDDDLDVPD